MGAIRVQRGVTLWGHAKAERLIGIDGWYIVWAILLIQLAFAILPGMDIAVSGWFHGEEGFAAASHPVLHAVRMAVWYMTLALFLGSLLALVIAAFGWYVADVPAKVWTFVALLYLLGPGVMVNGILKEYWGRARPAEVEAFGGPLTFTPPFQISDQCASNCSFVSGEASGATAMAVGLVVLARWVPGRGAQQVLAVGAVVIAAVAIVLRVAAGRHFLSDSIFSVLFTVGLAVLIDRGLQAVWPRAAVAE